LVYFTAVFNNGNYDTPKNRAGKGESTAAQQHGGSAAQHFASTELLNI